jgi:VanZ family protein
MLQRLSKIVTLSLVATIVVLSLVPPKLRPVSGIGQNYEHAVIFFITGIAAAIGYRRDARILCSVAIIFCGGLELLQKFVPGRHARMTDFMVDAGAAVLGLLLSSFLGWASPGPKSHGPHVS